MDARVWLFSGGPLEHKQQHIFFLNKLEDTALKMWKQVIAEQSHTFFLYYLSVSVSGW